MLETPFLGKFLESCACIGLSVSGIPCSANSSFNLLITVAAVAPLEGILRTKCILEYMSPSTKLGKWIKLRDGP